MRFVPVYEWGDLPHEAVDVLYALLQERTEAQTISHRKMPTCEEHRRFVASHPYKGWWIMEEEGGDPVGAVYLSQRFEIGVFVFAINQRQGYGTEAIKFAHRICREAGERMLANINPANAGSIALFQSMGFKHIQNTYEM